MKRSVIPTNMIIQVPHNQFHLQAREVTIERISIAEITNEFQNPKDWTTIQGWNFKYQHTPFSPEVKDQLQSAFNRGLSGASKCQRPYIFIPKVDLNIKPKPQPGDPPPTPQGVRLAGNTVADVQKLLLQARHMNFTVDESKLKEFPEYMEIHFGKGKRIELLHEQTPDLKVSIFRSPRQTDQIMSCQLPIGSLGLVIDISIGEISTATEMLLQSLMRFIVYLTRTVKRKLNLKSSLMFFFSS